MDMETLGWNSFFQQHLDQLSDKEAIPGRIIRESKNLYQVYSEEGELMAEISGKMRYEAQDASTFPTVGDWVALKTRPGEDRATIINLLPRQSKFSRKAVLSGGVPGSGGKTEEQVLAANIDTVFLVSGLDHDFNLRRIERYLSIAWDSGAAPVIILNKADLCDDIDSRRAEVEEVAFGVPLLTVSALDKTGLVSLEEYLMPGKTSVFLGSSGVGKSTIINSLTGIELLKTAPLRESDQRGKHTTTHRELILLPFGGAVIDTPGLREIQIWLDNEGMENTFRDVMEFAEQCRFRDCSHSNEPGCAVLGAIETGDLDEDRFQSYLKLQLEMRHLSIRQNVKARRQASKNFQKKIRRVQEERKKGLR
ncbi:MAG: ribosome small subunit-dependent GTPase A [Candidatus Adiutricales bacterium]